jgi:acyl-CoA synthetase (AMP-forming)/AMP-acid ligase II
VLDSPTSFAIVPSSLAAVQRVLAYIPAGKSLFPQVTARVVVLKPGLTAAPEELTQFCKARIATYKVPRSIALVDDLPMSGAGKILKRELRKQHWGDSNRQVS